MLAGGEGRGGDLGDAALCDIPGAGHCDELAQVVIVGEELLDGDRPMVRAELGGVEVRQASGTEHIDELKPRAEYRRVGQRYRRQHPKGFLHGVCDARGGSGGDDRVGDDHDAYPTGWA